MIVENIIPRNMIINLGCASVDNHIPRDDIFDYHPLRESNIYIISHLLTKYTCIGNISEVITLGDLLTFVCDFQLCFCYFPMWYLIVSIPDLCHLSYFQL